MSKPAEFCFAFVLLATFYKKTMETEFCMHFGKSYNQTDTKRKCGKAFLRVIPCDLKFENPNSGQVDCGVNNGLLIVFLSLPLSVLKLISEKGYT